MNRCEDVAVPPSQLAALVTTEPLSLGYTFRRLKFAIVVLEISTTTVNLGAPLSTAAAAVIWNSNQLFSGTVHSLFRYITYRYIQ